MAFFDYGSYSAEQGFGLVKGLLAYQHELSNQGAISINFKMEGEVSSNRSIFEFNDAGSTKLKAYRNDTYGFLTLMINDTPWYTSFPVPLVYRNIKLSHPSSFKIEPPSYFVKLPCVCVTLFYSTVYSSMGN